MRAIGTALIGLAALSGCRQLLGFDDVGTTTGDGPIIDSPIDGDVTNETTPIDGCTTFSTVLDTCLTTPTGALHFTSNASYDTTTFQLTSVSAMTAPQHVVVNTPTGELDALFATSIIIDAGVVVRFTGARPVALVASGDITIEGVVDVTAGGAGARNGGCLSDQGVMGIFDSGGGGGGGGGAYQGAGGLGGNGDADGGQSAGGAGGVARARGLAPLGGCRGGDGGGGPGTGGAGGLAGGAITIKTTITAGGGGGGGGQAPSGGGAGGGPGGMIILEGSIVNVLAGATVVAHGGGGGEGAGNINNGINGQNATISGSPALGGAGGATTGANGANSSGGAQLFGDTPGAVQSDGGGGGGGGAGYIAVKAGQMSNAGTISPVQQIWP